MKLVVKIYIIFYCCTLSLAQDFNNNYFPIRSIKIEKATLKGIINSNVLVAQHRIIKSNKVKSDFVKDVKSFYNRFATLDTLRLLMQNDTITNYLKDLCNLIIEANPVLKDRKISIFTFRDEEVNASNWGPQIILINLGLIAKSNTQEELVFTICHELAHEYLDHCYSSFEKRCTIANSSDFKKQVRKVKRAEYQSVKQAELLLARTVSRIMVNERKQEIEADSLGYIFYSNIGFNKFHVINDLKNLDSCEIPFYKNSINFQATFDPQNKFYRSEWDVIPKSHFSWEMDSSFWKIPDSLKTHPDSHIRVKKIVDMQEFKNPLIHNDLHERFEFIRSVARFELIVELLSNDDYANALYYSTLLIINDFPKNEYLLNVITNCFIEMAYIMRDHHFSIYVDQPFQFYYPEFNKVLYFLHNLNSKDLFNLAKQYFEEKLEKSNVNRFSKYNQLLIKGFVAKKEDFGNLIAEYKGAFKDKYYLKKLELRFKYKKP